MQNCRKCEESFLRVVVAAELQQCSPHALLCCLELLVRDLCEGQWWSWLGKSQSSHWVILSFKLYLSPFCVKHALCWIILVPALNQKEIKVFKGNCKGFYKQCYHEISNLSPRKDFSDVYFMYNNLHCFWNILMYSIYRKKELQKIFSS